MAILPRLLKIFRNKAVEPPKNRRRRGLFESLEVRRVLATDLASISGTVFSDQTDDGLTADDVLIQNATINLYQDGGDGMISSSGGTAGGDDTLLAITASDISGQYSFDRLSAGTYFVEEVVPAGFMVRSGDDFATVVIDAAQAQGTMGTSVDDFSTTNQSVSADSATTPTSTADAATEAIGGERDLFVQHDNGPLTVSLSANNVTSSLLITSQSSTRGTFIASWDGVDGDGENLDETGLGGAMLANGGAASFLQLMLGADQPGVQMQLQVFTDASNFSTFTTTLPDTGTGAATEELLVAFTDFTATGTGADFDNVGAIELQVIGVDALDAEFALVGAVGPTVFQADFANFEPLTLGDLVFDDLNNNGVFDSATESGVAGVTVNLYDDTDSTGDFSPGTDVLQATATTDASGNYQFTNLFPGNYVLQLDPSNFNAGNVLEDFFTSSGNDPAPDPDNDVDDDDNGSLLVGFGIVADAVTLSANAEPTNDGDADADTNLSVDFGVFTSADLAITKSDNPDPVVAGQQLTYTLSVTNNGPVDATGVTVSDPLPAGVTFNSATTTQGTFSEAGGVVTFNLGDMANGDSESLTITVDVNSSTAAPLSNVATVTGNENDVVAGNNSATAPTNVTTEIDLVITKSDNVDPIFPAQTLTYTLLVTNNGPSDATGVTVTDTLPGGVTFVNVTPTQGSGSESAGIVTANLGALTSGGSATVTIDVTVDNSTTGTITNNASVTASETETNSANNTVAEPTTVTPQIDLTITKSDSPDPVVAGNQLNYTLNVTNNGPSEATGVSVTDTLPAGVTFNSVNPSQGSASETGGVVTANLGTLSNGANATVDITVDVPASASGTLDNTASVSGNETESNSANNSDNESTQLNQEVDLQITKTDSTDPITPGDSLTYSLTVMNNGPSDATGVTVVDTLPAEVTFNSAVPSQGSASEAAGVVTAALGSLPTGQSATVDIIVTAGIAQGSITNTATVSSDETETNSANNTDAEVTAVDFLMSQIGGFAFVDDNVDGVFDAGEDPIPGVSVRLTGNDVLGAPVDLTQLTAADGSYLFDNLIPSDSAGYTVQETQPANFRDGIDTLGTPTLGGTMSDDQFSGLNLPDGTTAENFNFGERARLSKRRFLASSG